MPTFVAGFDARALAAERTRLVNALAALGRQRAAIPIDPERLRLVEALRAASLAAPPGRPPAGRQAGGRGDQRPAAAPPAQPRQSARQRRDAAMARAGYDTPAWPGQQGADWQFEFRIAPLAAAQTLSKTFVPIIGLLIFGGIAFSGLRCLFTVAIFAAIIWYAAWRAATSQVITCRQAGFTYSVASGNGRRAAREYAWEQVSELRYYEETKRQRHLRTEAHLMVFADGTKIFDQSNAHNAVDFGRLMSIFNRMTTHLPYTWVPSDELRGRQILERRKFYSKISRIRSDGPREAE